MMFRKATKDDAAGIADVVHAMKELHSVAEQPLRVTTDIIEANLKQMASPGGSCAYVATDTENTVVGYCTVHWVPFLFFAGGEAYVTELFVRPSDCAKGIGSKLLDAVVNEAKDRGCSRVSLLNGRDGESYRRSFYQKRGWIERDRMANFILPLYKGPNRPPQRNAGSRPPSDESPASDILSSPAPRG